jgi:hypothetical protein
LMRTMTSGKRSRPFMASLPPATLLIHRSGFIF